MVSKILVVTSASGVLLLIAYNTIFFVIKLKKYRVPTILLFYVVGFLLTCCTISYSLIVPLNNICGLGWMIAYYGGSFFNMVLGIVQASNITILGTRLYYSEKLSSTLMQSARQAVEDSNIAYASCSLVESSTREAKQYY